jgi:hypothetical protein
MNNTSVRHFTTDPRYPDYLIPGPAIQFVTIVRFPRIFSDDHIDRDLPTGQCIRESQTTRTWACNDAELSEWRSDANYYSDCDRAGSGWGDPTDNKALGRGARRIVEIIDALDASYSSHVGCRKFFQRKTR